ncbi:MAG: nickel transporter [Alphaproteobacteria bacterium]|nr:nickel transporter [Alphaproteobacteria bacterium]
MSEFSVIPVIDLKEGVVVHAKGGKRADYQPLETPLGPADDPLAIARALLEVTGSPVLYVADLDAIEGTGSNYDMARALADVLPTTTLWIDAGFSDADECAFWLPLGATLVIGSETLASQDAWRGIQASLGHNAMLSLDFDGDALRGPEPLLTQSALWPDRLIVMSLKRVGTGEGPDFARLKDVLGKADARAIYTAGGVRNADDLKRAKDEGARGALLATALHSGAVTQKEIASLK